MLINDIIVPLDSSSLAECVLPHAIAIAKAFNTPITLLHVLEQPSASLRLPKPDPLDWYLKKLEATAYLEATKARLEASQLSVSTLLLEGNATEKIVELTHATAASLLVLCGHGEAKENSEGLSSVAQRILQKVRASTLIVRNNPNLSPPTSDIGYRKLLVPLDGSQRSGSVLTLAAALAEKYQSELLLVHVVCKPEMARLMPLSQDDAELSNKLIERNTEEGRKYLELLSDQMPSRPQTRLLVSNNVVDTLQEVSQQEQIDLLVLSAHGYSGDAQYPYGSVAHRFINSSAIPLLIVQDLRWESPEAARAGTVTRQPIGMYNGN